MGHSTRCRLSVEVLSRLTAIERVTWWPATTPAQAAEAADQLAGWAALHLAVVIEYGCDCPDQARLAA